MRIRLENIPFINRKAIPWIIWGIVGLYYLFEITLRVLPSTMRPQLTELFQINATQFGIFTSLYYVTYTWMQIPCGLIVDRFSIRKTLFVACLLCISGLLLIHATSYLPLAYAGRLIVGFGSAFAYVYTLKVASIWLPRNHFGLATCIADSLGMIGAIFADTIFVKINLNSGVNYSVTILFMTGILIASLIFFVFRDKPDTKQNIERNKQEMRDFTHIVDKVIRILKNPQIWLIGLVGCLFYLPSSVIGDVWGIPYLKAVYSIGEKEAGWMISTFLAGWVIAGPFLGAYSDRTEKRVMPMAATITLATICFSIIIFTPPLLHVILPRWVLFSLFFLIGVSMGTHPLVFALAKENFPNRIAGTVVAVINTLTMLGGMIFQPVVGVLLDYSNNTLHATGAVSNYTATNYTFALSIIPISLLICLILMFFIRETGDNIHRAEPEFDVDGEKKDSLRELPSS